MAHDIFSGWSESTSGKVKRHDLLVIEQRPGTQKTAASEIANVLKSHYIDPSQYADRAQRLGLPAAAKTLEQRLPKTKRARSGDVGEILATELVNLRTDYQVPVNRLRWKDGREMAMRGDDVIGVRVDGSDKLHLLKGEVKSRVKMTKTVLSDAIAALRRNHGRPSAHSLNFVMDRLFDAGADDLAISIEQHLTTRSVPTARMSHFLFCFSQNSSGTLLREYLKSYGGKIRQFAASLEVLKHKALVARIFRDA